MEIPQPTAAHRRLEGLVGTFKSRETIHPSEHMQQGGVADTICVGRWVCNGFAVSLDYEQKVGGRVVYAGHGVVRHDMDRNDYELDWFDSMAPNGTNFRGYFTGDKLTLETQRPNPMRLIYDFSLRNGYHFRMEMKADGVSWRSVLDGDNVKVSMQAKYARKKKKAAPKKKKAATRKKAGKKKTAKKKTAKKKTTKKKPVRKKPASKKKAGKKKSARKRRR